MWNVTTNKSWWQIHADKGFTIQHILLTKQAAIFILPSLGKRNAFAKEVAMLIEPIAKARIHVERFNEPLKKNRILDRVVPLNLLQLLPRWYVLLLVLLTFRNVYVYDTVQEKIFWCKHSTIFTNLFFPNVPVLHPLKMSEYLSVFQMAPGCTKMGHCEVNGLIHVDLLYLK